MNRFKEITYDLENCTLGKIRRKIKEKLPSSFNLSVPPVLGCVCDLHGCGHVQGLSEKNRRG